MYVFIKKIKVDIFSQECQLSNPGIGLIGKKINGFEIEPIQLSGTITLTQGQDVITGIDTKFSSEVIAGEIIQLMQEEKPCKIKEIISDTQMVLEELYSGTTSSGTAEKGKGKVFYRSSEKKNIVLPDYDACLECEDENVTDEMMEAAILSHNYQDSKKTLKEPERHFTKEQLRCLKVLASSSGFDTWQDFVNAVREEP